MSEMTTPRIPMRMVQNWRTTISSTPAITASVGPILPKDMA